MNHTVLEILIISTAPAILTLGLVALYVFTNRK